MRNGAKRLFKLLVICCWSLAIMATSAFGDPQFIISGHVQTSDGTGISGVNIAGDNGAGSTVTGEDGAYSITVPNQWSGTVTASLAGYSFTATNYSNVTADQTDQDFAGFQPVISGYTYYKFGVTITASGVGSVVSDSPYYYYSITVPYGWSGTLTASFDGFYFDESPRSYTNVTTSRLFENFTPYQPSISGYVRIDNGSALSGAWIIAEDEDGNHGGVTMTNSSGYFSFAVPYGWSGTVSVTLPGYHFAAKSYTNVISDQVDEDFTTTELLIYGHIKSYTGSYLSGATVSASGTGSAITDWDGFYEIPIPNGWSGTLTASMSGYYFGDPVTFANMTTSLQNDFTAKGFKICGYVTDETGAGVSNISLSASGLSGVHTNGNGYYELPVSYGWSGTITPTNTDYSFNPVNKTYTNVMSDINDENFTTSQVSVFGMVRNKQGTPLSGVVISADNGGSATTDPNGRYVLNLPYNWTGTITPQGGYSFSPANRTCTNITDDVYDVNFEAAQPRVCGVVTDMNGVGVAGVTVTAGTNYSTTTDTNGNYALMLPYNWTSTITPLKTGWLFSPSSRTYHNLVTDQNDQNFTKRTPIISGYVKQTLDYSPVPDVNVSLSGVGSTLTDVNGFFSITVPAGWSGTLIMQKEGWLFNTASFTNVNTDQMYFAYLTYGGGDGSDGNPFRIETARQLYLLARQSSPLNKSFIVVNDINMAELENPPSKLFAPIGASRSPFSGSFDGGGYAIRNLKLSNSSTYNGLFGYVCGSKTKAAVIKNVRLIDPQINLPVSSYVGGLAGGVSSYANIDNCCVSGGHIIGRDYTGGLFGAAGGSYNLSSTISITHCGANTSVRGNNYVGGLAGTMASNVQQSYANCDVNGFNNVGGLAGSMAGQAQNCYTAGTTKGAQYVGGLVGSTSYGDRQGSQLSPILNCYAVCKVTGTTGKGGLVGYIQYGGTLPGVLGSYWDADASGILTSAAGIGKTTTQMKSLQTFSGWGCDGAWTLNDGADYPRLAWENKPGVAISEPMYGGGTGDVNDPYLLYTARQLNTMGQTYCHLGKAFKLMADIDMSELEPNEFVPIGKGMGFTGIFDGNDHAIMNLNYKIKTGTTITQNPLYGGLFGQLGKIIQPSYPYVVLGGTVKNLLLIDPVVDVNGNYAGALCGYAVASTIENCQIINGTVKGKQYVGGAIGRQDGSKAINIRCQASVTGIYDTGGIVGYATYGPYPAAQSSNFRKCMFTGNVQGGSYMGGFAGYISSSADVNECFSAADVNGLDYTGGFAGYNIGSIKLCGAKGKLTGRTYTGGFVGYLGNDLNDCYSACDVNGFSIVGGFAGYVNSGWKASRCYSEGRVDANNTEGAFAGYCYYSTEYNDLPADFSACFYNVDKEPNLPALSNITNADVAGKTSGQMREADTYLNGGWDFTDETVNGMADIWTICEGANTPRFVWQIAPADFACPDGVDLIDFALFAEQWLNTNCASSNNCEGADMDKSGTVDMSDLVEFASWWLE